MKIDSMVTCNFCGANNFLTNNDLPENWHGTEEVNLCPDCLLGIKKGVAAAKEGKITPFRGSKTNNQQ